ncbi:hypothetical protein BH11MYX1_BH11MYX1_27980 [soil metagenome]
MAETANLDALLAHADWLRGLARKLVGSDPEDAVQATYVAAPAAAPSVEPSTVAWKPVQATYVAALSFPPDPALPARPWLARVLRNVTRMGHRSTTRRTSREQAVSTIAVLAPSIDDTVGRAEAFRMLVELVLALGEPYRTTLIRHYFDCDSLGEIARRDGIPEATVRGRHRHALAQLRTKLDARAERSAWLASLAPLAAPPAHIVSLTPGALLVNKILIAVAVALVAGGVAWEWYPRTSAEPVPPAISRVATQATTSATRPAQPPKHVLQLASTERAKLARQIATAQANRANVRAAAPRPVAGESMAATTRDVDLDHEVIRDAMREVVPFLAECYEQSRTSLHADHLAIHAHFTLTGDPDIGTIIDAKRLFDDDKQPLPAKLDDCLRNTLQTLELPPLRDGDTVEVDYPLLFADSPPDSVPTL